MIRSKDFDDIGYSYLENNPDFAKQLLTTLNQVDDLSTRNLQLWSYSDDFELKNNEISIISANSNDLLKLEYYQILMQISKYTKLDEEDEDVRWIYYPNKLIIKKSYKAINDYFDDINRYYRMCFSIKLDQPINKYDEQQITSICDFLYDVSQLFYKKKKLEESHFRKDAREKICHFFNSLNFMFVLNDFENPLIKYRHIRFDSKLIISPLKDTLKPNAPAMKYLKTFNLVQNIKSIKL